MNPRGANQPNVDPSLHALAAPETSLVESLGSIVDDVQQIATDLGARPYRVFSVTYRWSGGDVGRGLPEVISETELLPTPETSSMTAIRRNLLAGGTVERGGLTLKYVSPRYSEDQLDDLCFGTQECQGPGVQTFIEVSIDRRDGDRTRRRRFAIAAAPYRDVDAMSWRIDMIKQDADRSPSGVPGGVPSNRDPFSVRR